ncbi:MAG: hypothetical protein M1833_007328 [Piccolia ochrophora]|nr:MAG: hypothetical protein M1833_007328 [Piccolia ochrophora]
MKCSAASSDSSDLEPAGFEHRHSPAAPPNVPCPPNTTERRLITRIDLRMLPVLCILYLFAFLDRVNIGNAVIYGLEKDIGLRGNQYNIALTVFFVPYVIFEFPSNLLLKRFKPQIWLSLSMFLFGLVMTCQGLVQNFSGLVATRFFLGLAESGVFPGCFYLMSMWYTRKEAQKRFTFFFSSTSFAGAFGGLLASGFGSMDYDRGYRGWRWIFILEGVMTCVVALIMFFLIPNFPEDTAWLSSAEKDYITARTAQDQRGAIEEGKITAKGVATAFKDYKILLGGLMYFGLIVPAYGFAYFAPTIIKSYGYSNIQTQLHSVPPHAVAFVFAMLIAAASDFTRHRFSYIIGLLCLAITGFGILITVHDNTKLQYGALFLVSMGVYPAMPIVICWFTMNFSGHTRRALGTAWMIGFGNIGGIVATFSFPQADAKNFYHKGYSICLGFVCLTIVTSALYAAGLWTENRQRAKKAAGGEKEWDAGYRYLL